MVKAGLAGLLALGLAGGVVHYAYGGSTAPAAKPAAAVKPVQVVMRYLGGPASLKGARMEIWGNGRELRMAGWEPNGALREVIAVDLARQELAVYTAARKARYTADTTGGRPTVEAMVGQAQRFLKLPVPEEGEVTEERRVEGGRTVNVLTAAEKKAGRQVRRVYRYDAQTGECLGLDLYLQEGGSPEQHVQSFVITPGAALPPSLANLKLPAGTRQGKGTLAQRPQADGSVRLVMLDEQGAEVWAVGGTLPLQ